MRSHELRGHHRWLIPALSISVAVISASPDGQVVSAETSVFDRLRLENEVPKPKPPTTAAERSIVTAAETVPAQRLIPGTKRHSRKISVPLRGTVREYVASVVSSAGKPQLKLTSSGFVPCSRNKTHRCVAVVGDPCRKTHNEDCEGMFLTVVIDVDAAYSLDRAVGGGRYRVESQDDIEDLSAEAP